MMAGMTEPLMIYRAVGCKACNGTGVVGRTAIFERIPITEELRTMINDRASDPELRACARRDGARSLLQDGFQKVIDGIIALEELKRVAERDRALFWRGVHGTVPPEGLKRGREPPPAVV